MKKLKYIVLLFLSITALWSYAQKGKLRKATKEYDNYAYIKTTSVLLDVAENGYKSVELFQKLGNSYYFTNDMVNATKWYKELMMLGKIIDPEYYWRYAQALKGIEDYAASDKWMQKFYDSNPEDSRAKAFSSVGNYLQRIESSSNLDIDIRNLSINSELSDFGANEYNGQFIFASSRGDGKVYSWNDEPFLNLYSVSRDLEGNFGTPAQFDETISTKYHESSPAFTPNKKNMFFTRNNFYKGKDKKDSKNTNHLNIYRATINYDTNGWNDVEPVEINSETYSVAHPALSSDGKKLFFASDMPGGKGNSDLYVSDILANGKLGLPENLGKFINAEGSENFPFINENGDLFFSSNSYPGLGGLDIYVVRNFETMLNSSNRNFVVQNLGKPINSPQDDFAYYENIKTKEGYFSSNRPGGKGGDDIYSFTIPQCKQLLEGVVKDKDSNELLPNTTVTLFDNAGNSIATIQSDDKAVFTFDLQCVEASYRVRGQRPEYVGEEMRITTNNESQTLNITLLLEKDVEEFQPCDDLAKVLDIPVIRFDYNKAAIRYDAEVELQKVLAVLNEYPTMTIEIRSHTDCRGTMTYNQRLSTRRAQSTRQYLIDKGIDQQRITAKGYGESRLLNTCACEPPNTNSGCSKAEHQVNRRSEFIVSTFKGKSCTEK